MIFCRAAHRAFPPEPVLTWPPSGQRTPRLAAPARLAALSGLAAKTPFRFMIVALEES